MSKRHDQARLGFEARPFHSRLHPRAVRITFMPNDVFAIFDTTEGTFKVRLFADRAPRRSKILSVWPEAEKPASPFTTALSFIASFRIL